MDIPITARGDPMLPAVRIMHLLTLATAILLTLPAPVRAMGILRATGRATIPKETIPSQIGGMSPVPIGSRTMFNRTKTSPSLRTLLVRQGLRTQA